jgi:hypothetical protein
MTDINITNLFAVPEFKDLYCKCGHTLTRVSNGLFGIAFFCTKCENVYTLKLIKAPAAKVDDEFIAQCRKRSESRQ